MRLKAFAALVLTLLPAASGDLLDDVVNAIKNAIDCGACHALLVPLQVVAHNESAFTNLFTEICQILRVNDDDVCKGALQRQGPVLAQVLKSISPFGNTSTKLCNAILGLCQPPPVVPYQISFPKEAPSKPKTWISKGNPPFQVAHFSDVHVDREYTPGTESDCNKPICCRKYPDYPKATMPAGQTGSLNCDASSTLVRSMLQAVPTNKFSIFTGDVVESSSWTVDKAHNIDDMNLFNNDMTTYLKGPVYAAIGNHEAAPLSLFPRNTTINKASDVQWIFDTQAGGWSSWLDADAQSQIRHFSGSYAQVVPGTVLRVISLNTMYWYKQNYYLFDSDLFQPDPNGILAFLVEQLQEAEDAGQRVWIIGHISPGDPDALWDQSNYFDQIAQRYKDTIAAQFYGHSHLDQFEVAYSDYSDRNAQNAFGIAMIAPSLTPRRGNPAFKYYDVDPDTYELMDVKTYRGDLTSASFQTNPTWSEYYSVRDTWGLLAGWPRDQPLTPVFWHKLTEVFEINNTAFQQYNTFLTRGILVASCDTTCKTATICGLRAQRAENNCVVASPGLNFLKRSEAFEQAASLRHVDACESVHLGHILAKLPRAFADWENESKLREVVAKHIGGEM